MKSKGHDPKEFLKRISANECTLEEILQSNHLIQTEVKSKFGKLTNFFCNDDTLGKLLFYSLNHNLDIQDFEHLSHNSCEILSTIKNQTLLDKLTTELEDISSEEKEDSEESDEEEESSESSSQFSEDIVEYTNVNTNDLEKKISDSAFAKKFSKKYTILDDAFSSSLKEVDKSVDKRRSCFPFIDKLFEYLFNKHSKLKAALSKHHAIANVEKLDSSEAEELTLPKLEEFNKEPFIDELLSGYFSRIFINILQQRRNRVSNTIIF